MGSPALWGRLVNFEASLRKPALIYFGSFSPGDNLGFIADMPTNGATFSPTLTPPNGTRTTFTFSALPLYIVWNNTVQFQNIGYTLTGPVAGIYTATFMDYAGNILTPGSTDSIIAQTTTLNEPSSGGQQVSRASVAWASNLTIDTSIAQVITVLLTGNVTATNLTYQSSSAVPNGTAVSLRFQQNGTGGWTVTLPANLAHDSGFAIDPGASRTTVLPILYNGNTAEWEFTAAPFSVTGS